MAASAVAATLKRMTSPLLMIEDDSRLAQMVVEYLGQSGFDVTHASDGEQGLEQLQLIQPELVILDLMMPGIDGLEVCRRIRSLPGDAGRVPVLMLTAKGDPMDRIIGLELGADDYLPKPFEPRELLARVRAVLRRRGDSGNASVSRTSPVLRFGSLDIDRDARTVQVAGQLCELTSYQFDLLVAMAERAGRVLTSRFLKVGEGFDAPGLRLDVPVPVVGRAGGPCAANRDFRFGAGRHDITGPVANTGGAGWEDPVQVFGGLHTRHRLVQRPPVRAARIGARDQHEVGVERIAGARRRADLEHGLLAADHLAPVIEHAGHAVHHGAHDLSRRPRLGIQPDDAMTVAQQPRHQGLAEPARRSGHQYVHASPASSSAACWRADGSAAAMGGGLARAGVRFELPR